MISSSVSAAVGGFLYRPPANLGRDFLARFFFVRVIDTASVGFGLIYAVIKAVVFKKWKKE